jgi:hypothetical protein
LVRSLSLFTQDQHSALHDLVTKIDPTAEFCRAINDGLIPGHGLRFDLFPVAKPAYIKAVFVSNWQTARTYRSHIR